MLVSHDRYLLDRVSQRILALDGKGHADYFADLGQWEEFRDNQRTQALVKREPEKTKPKLESLKQGKALSAKEKKELEGMESALRACEERLKEAQLKLEDPAVATQLTQLVERQKTVETEKAELEILFKRWEELEAKKREDGET